MTDIELVENAAEKRVMIAKDVLKLIELGRLKPARMTYLHFPDTAMKPGLFGSVMPIDPSSDADVDALAQAKCEGCAMGALFLSSLLQFRQGPSRRDYNAEKASTIRRYLLKFFPFQQLRSIEDVFECWSSYVNFPEYGRFLKALPDRYPSTVLKAIMQNIVDNNGDFVLA